MKSMLKRTTLREIRGSFGRYAAILAIVALGVGFFSGLKMTKPLMIATVDNYLDEQDLFDLRLLSSLGFLQQDIDSFQKEQGVKAVEGSYSYDILCKGLSENEGVLKAHSLTESVNKVTLKAGRMPQNSTECVADSRLVKEDQLGTVITLTDSNEKETLAAFSQKEYTIVGIVDASYYMNFERGTTSLGNGRVQGFIYLPSEAFTCDYYTEVFVRFCHDYKIYSDEYRDFIEEMTDKWNRICAERGKILCGNLPVKPEYYVLDRTTNIGYVCFENDSSIVEGIADVFPVFFFMVAALVCATTMNRMVEEQRTQIGVLKALGYREAAIMGKFMFYSGSSALIGCIGGYFGGTIIFPKVIWKVYEIMYSKPALLYDFHADLAILSVLISLLCTIGTTWLSCRCELSRPAAGLMRPKAPKAGKRVFLERIPIVWKHLKFLQKVSARNIIRYKKRFFMMVIGISGCSALLVAGLGLKDSVAGLARQQFGEIQISDGSISLQNGITEEDKAAVTEKLNSLTECYTFAHEESETLLYDGNAKDINVVVMETPGEIDRYLNLHTTNDLPLSYPGEGQAVISHKIADAYAISKGDKITLRNENMQEITVTVSGVFENFIYNYVYISPKTYASQMGNTPEYQTVYVNYKDRLDIHEAAASFMKMKGVSAITVNRDIEERFDTMMSSMNYVVLLVIACAAALAFIVLYNLTNINITERIREIATIKVLGFYKKETSAYVFRENAVLTAIGTGAGLILGYFLHGFIMSQIDVDMVAFDVHIRPVSYFYSVVLTFLFNFLINRVMSFKLDAVNMAESLKSVD